jgi:hypothetical protein
MSEREIKRAMEKAAKRYGVPEYYGIPRHQWFVHDYEGQDYQPKREMKFGDTPLHRTVIELLSSLVLEVYEKTGRRGITLTLEENVGEVMGMLPGDTTKVATAIGYVNIEVRRR